MPPDHDQTTLPAGAVARRLRAVLVGLLVAVPCYAGGVLLGIGLVQAFSDNGHDRSVEAAMTGAFFVGPVAAVAGFVCGALVFARRSRAAV